MNLNNAIWLIEVSYVLQPSYNEYVFIFCKNKDDQFNKVAKKKPIVTNVQPGIPLENSRSAIWNLQIRDVNAKSEMAI